MIVFNIFHNNLAMIISKDPTLMIGIGTTISILSSLFLVIPFASLSGSVFVSIDKPRLSLLLSFLKYLVLELGFILIFIYFGFGTNGICYGVIAGCTVGCIISFILLSKFFKEHIDLNKIEENIE